MVLVATGSLKQHRLLVVVVAVEDTRICLQLNQFIRVDLQAGRAA